MTLSTSVAATPTGRGRSRAVTMLLAVIVTFAAIGTMGAAPASANTPSDYSKTFYVGGAPGFQGQPITVGWTQDHAWVIANWSAALAAGSGFIASQLCSIVSGESGPLNPLGRACSTAVSGLVAQLTAGQSSLTDHGLWLEYYIWAGQTTQSGTW